MTLWQHILIWLGYWFLRSIVSLCLMLVWIWREGHLSIQEGRTREYEEFVAGFIDNEDEWVNQAIDSQFKTRN